MINIIVNGKEAVLKKDITFEYIAENRDFTEADDYTLDIEFPLKGCSQNIAIFGHVNRLDADHGGMELPCEISTRNFYKSGVLTITDISENSIKTQFLEGKSAQNFYSAFDDIYINELDLDRPTIIKNNSSPRHYQDGFDSGVSYVVLPWCNNASGIIQNDISNGSWAYDDDFYPAAQQFLLHNTIKICEQLGYSYDFTAWKNSGYRHLIICNALPISWNITTFADALPHWSVTKYFEQLGLLLNGDFDINHEKRTISFSFYRDIALNYPTVVLENIIDEIAVEVSDDSCSYREAKVLKYADNEAVSEHFYSCDWFINKFKDKAVEFATMDDFISSIKDKYLILYPSLPHNKLYYVAEYDCYFILSWRNLTKINVSGADLDYNVYHIMPLNRFAPSRIDDDAEEEELEIVPVPIEFLDESHQYCIYLNPGDEEIEETEETEEPEVRTHFERLISEGDKSQETCYDKIYVGFWEPSFFDGVEWPYPYPLVDNFYFLNITHLQFYDKTLILRNNPLRQKVYNIDAKTKYNIKFLSDSIPNPRSVFLIDGKKYLCEKITATFSVHGMSQLQKGVFYRIND